MTSCLIPIEIEPHVRRFYRLVWQPAAWMHPAWWTALALDAWQPVYRSTPLCRRWINQAVMTRRCFPEHVVSYTFTPLEQRILNLSERLPSLFLALGLLRLARTEYWILKPYLEVIRPYLDPLACMQLSTFSAMRVPEGFHVSEVWIEPEQLVGAAWRQGAAVLAGNASDSQTPLTDSVLRALEILFTPGIFTHTPLNGTAAVFGLELLFRLARFL